MTPKKQSLREVLKAFTIELPVFAVLMTAYVVFVLHFLTPWLTHLFHEQRKWYAAVALGLIVGQGFVLELLARSLLGLIRGKGSR